MLKFLIWITTIAFTLGSLGQVLRFSGTNLYLFDLVIIVSNIYLLGFLIKKQKFYINKTFLIFLFFSIFTLIITFFRVQGFLLFEQLFTLSFWLRFNLYFIFGYLIFNLIRYKYLEFEVLKVVLTYNLYILIFLNFVQFYFLRDISFMAEYGFDPHTQRLTGFFLDPNFMGFYLILFLFLNEFYLKKKFLSYLILFQIILTDSRSAFLTLVLFLSLYLLLNFQKSLLLIFFSIILFFFSNLDARFNHLIASNDSASLRIESWANAIEVYSFASNFGIGFNNYRNYLIGFNLISPDNYFLNSSNYSDSSLLSVLAFSGILGLFIFVCLLLSFMKNFRTSLLLLLIFFNSLIINSLFFPATAFLIFLILNWENT
jgi:hypothetical protein